MREREPTVGLEPDDAASQWLDENEPPKPIETPKAARKSKLLHRYRQEQLKKRPR